MERIGIYADTFNPVHKGNISAALRAAESLCLDKILLIPDLVAPNKQQSADSADFKQRLRMLQIAVKDHPRLEVPDPALPMEGENDTWQTIPELRKRYPAAQLIFLMADGVEENAGIWHPEEQGMETCLLENSISAVSPEDLRRLLVFQCADAFLPEGVGAYIREQGLYGTAVSCRNLPMETLEQVVVSLLKPNRVAHVLGCRDTAVALAKRWGTDETDAARAGILHDITKALDGPLQLTLCAEYGTMLSDFSRKYPKTLHALTGSLVAERIFGENEAVVSAIRHHTTGKADMNLLEKIIYVADYMEPNRDFPGVEELRALAFSDMDAALKLGLEMTLQHLKRQGSEVSPESREALAFLNR